jgi:dolichol-phosphate mannosyltransferase
VLSIVIPTFNESENVFLIVKSINDVLCDIPFELIFIDDSTDDTPLKLAELSKLYPNVRFEHRTSERGLGTAVVRGFELANGDIITVMDADLQHPPEMIPTMIRAIDMGADIVIPSRFIPGGDDGGLNLIRKLISATARYMGKFALKALRRINDPTSGFFMFRKSVIENVILRPIGWKILIEILVRGNYNKVIEVSYRFRARNAGDSKMSLKEQWNYIRHLINLVKDSPQDRRFYLFAMVGISGIFVNMIVYTILIRLNFGVSVAGSLSALTAMLSNFFLNDQFTWSEVKNTPLWIRMCKFFTTSILGIIIDICVLSLLYHVNHIHYLVSNLLGIMAGTLWNYCLNNLWTWRTVKKVSNRAYIIRWTESQS